MARGWAGMLVVIAVASGSIISAEGQVRTENRSGKTLLWTLVGAGAGFGIGLWAGLTAFDDAINSDRKVWMTAIVSSAAGGVAGYLVGHRLDASPQMTLPRSTAIGRTPSVLAASEAPRLGSGEFRVWLEREALTGLRTARQP